MKTPVLIAILMLLTLMLCACGEDEAPANADSGGYIPPATDTPPVTADTPNPSAPDGSSTLTPSTPGTGNSQPDVPATPVTVPLPVEQVTVCIDAGHGGKDPGAVWEDRLEKDDTLALALLVAKYVEDAGHIAVLTRSDDSKVSLSERCKTANENDADVFVSIHRNSFEGAKGVEIWISYQASDENVAFAENILAALAEVGISKDRGVKKGTQASSKEDYQVNRSTNMPSCLIELGFITSDEDNQLLDTNMDAYAKAIAEEAIKEAMRITDEAK